jgi:hypothetical protein
MKITEIMTETVKQRLDAKCWKGKHKEGTKIKGGIRVNNCVPNNESAMPPGPTPQWSKEQTAKKDQKKKDFAKSQMQKKKESSLEEGYGRYYCSTDKKWKERKGPKQTRNVSEAGSPAQQAAIAINMKKHHQKPKNEAEGDPEGLPHLTPDLADHIAQQIDTEGPHAIVKSVEWGDGASEELTQRIQDMLEKIASIKAEMQNVAEQKFDAIEEMVESWAEAHSVDSELIWEDLESVDDSELLSEAEAWQTKKGKNKNGGLNKKGVASYRRSHPGSKLQTAVTTKPSKLKKGSKAAKRRKSFCARMSGVKGPMKKPNGKPTRKALALRKWHC